METARESKEEKNGRRKWTRGRSRTYEPSPTSPLPPPPRPPPPTPPPACRTVGNPLDIPQRLKAASTSEKEEHLGTTERAERGEASEEAGQVKKQRASGRAGETGDEPYWLFCGTPNVPCAGTCAMWHSGEKVRTFERRLAAFTYARDNMGVRGACARAARVYLAGRSTRPFAQDAFFCLLIPRGQLYLEPIRALVELRLL